MLISLRLSFVAILFAAFFGSAGTALAQGLMPGKSLVDARLDVADAFEFAELASASEVLGDSTYLMVFNPPTYDDQWRRLNQNYRLLLALTLDEESDGRAALLAAATAMNGERDDHAQALALEALGKLDTEQDRALATAIIDMLTGRIQKRYSGQQRDRLWQLARQIGPFGPYRATAAQEGDYARLCARFSQSIEASHRVDYRDLVTVSPRPPVERFVVLDGGRQLCLVGAEFERTYDLTIREGLKAKNGTRLRETVAFNLTTPGRNPELRLPGQGYVLPASGTQLVPVETVNQEALKVQLFHLDERNITQVLRRGILAQNTADITDPRDIYEYIEERTGTFRDRVSEVFEGTLSIDMLKHQRRRDGISIAEMIDGPAKRGLYLLTLQGKVDSDVTDLKWIMVTDLALTTVDTPEGLFINAVDTRNGVPVFENVAVEMVTRGNRVMQPVATDDAASAFFAASQLKGQNADEPLYLYASHPELGDAFLALGRAPIEIETESGLPTLKSGALDLWAKADRGQYREGETARVVGLLRQTRPSQDVLMPKTLLGRVLDPNGDVVQTMDIDLSAANGFEAEVALPIGARQGRWSLNISLGEGLPSLRSVSIPVADFVPPSVEIELAELPALRFDGTDEITVQVDYLFGAPAKNLNVNLSGRLAPKPDIDGFNIGLEQEEFVFARPFDLFGRTEKDGSVTFTLPAYRLPDQTTLSVVGIEAVVTDAAGREERVNGLAELATEETFVGLKPAFDIDRPVEEGSEVTFTAAALLGDGSLTTGKADWVLYREIYDYNWYFDGGRWNYESSYIDLPVSEGTLDLDGETPLSLDVDWGAYRIEIVDQNGLSATSLRFNAGWRALPQVDRAPGRLGVTVSTAEPQPGDSIDFVIDSPFAGAGLVYLVGSETRVESLGTLSEGSNDLSLTLPDSWDNAEGLWLLPVVYSQGATGVEQLPARAVGASFVGFDHRPVTLDLALETDDEVKPRETLTVPVSIGDLAEGETAYALSWIVDDGVLKMTGYQSPDPLKHFLDPYALPADLRDTFAAMIASAGLEAAALKQGFGDEVAFAARALAVDGDFSLAQGVTTRIKETLALTSTLVELDENGDGSLSFEVPDFVGRGRLMTVAWTSEGRLGKASQMLQIRDAVVADLFLPRFLAPGDEIDVRLLLSNTQEVGLATDLSLRLGEGLSLAEGANRMSFDLEAKGQQTVPLRLKAGDFTGATAITIEVATSTETIERTFPIEVRPIAPREVVRDSFILEDGETFTLDPELLAELKHSAIQMTVTPANSINAGFLADELSAYPFRCTEQTTSRAIGLLLGEDLDFSQDRLDSELNSALVTLQNRRASGGLVGLWSGYGEGDLFLQTYAADFLALADEDGLESASALRAAFVDRLKRGLKLSEDPYYGRPVTFRTQAYSLAVMARAGQADIAAQRLLFDKLVEQEGQDFAKAALAVAAHAVGDRADRDALVESMLAKPATTEETLIENYGSSFRDQLAALALLAEADLLEDDAVKAYFAETLPRLVPSMDHRYLTTQEQAWALRLSQHLGASQGTFLNLEGEPWDEDYKPRLTPADFDGSQSITNVGGDPILVSLWQAGAPLDTTKPVAEGLSVNRLMFDLDSLQPVTNPAPGQRVLVAVMGTAFEVEALDYVLADLLPAGFEVEQTGLPSTVRQYGGRVGECRDGESTLVAGICEQDGEKAFQQTGNDYAEARTDRVLFGFNLGRGSFAHYYVMRRTQAGIVTHPGAYIEAMYAPALRARSSSTLLK